MSGRCRIKGLLIGVAGSIGGLMAMRAYWRFLAPEVDARLGDDESKGEGSKSEAADVSLVGKQHKESESATAAVGRLAYRQVKGDEAISQDSKELLSNLVHWGYGLLQGGIYGLVLRRGGPLSGLIYSTGLWFIGDEIIVPMLGLQPGPASVSLADHVNRLGAHWSYGLGTGVTTRMLDRIL